jgi:hypothetical protein
MKIVPLKAIFSRKPQTAQVESPDYALLIVDHLPNMDRQCRRAAKSPESYRSAANVVDNESNHHLTEVIDHLKADDFKVLREFRGNPKLTTYLTMVTLLKFTTKTRWAIKHCLPDYVCSLSLLNCHYLVPSR